MMGPRKILELDGNPKSRWKLETEALHLFRGSLWEWEVAGCILCSEMSDSGHQTLVRADDDGAEHHHCLEHGPLDQVGYSIRRTCVVRIGNVEREFHDVEEDHLFFPRDMTAGARTKLTEAMIQEAQEEARKQDWLPAED